MPYMFTRTLTVPNYSFFLLGPRATGKSTWIQERLPAAKIYNFLNNDVLIRFLGSPSLLRQEVLALPDASWVVLDEVQKVPSLLDEVHSVMNERGENIRFCLTGSSARKLRGANANMLAGRALLRNFFPLTALETGSAVSLDQALRLGTLPRVCNAPELAPEILDAYVATYLKEEIQQEALAQKLDSFTRFLKVAAIMNGQVVNTASIARDAGVARQTVQRYFQVLVDTLIGVWVPGWRPRLKVREQQSPKFYFFDTGIVRALLQRTREPIDGTERGPLLETYVLHELRAYIDYHQRSGEISYYRTPAGVEVDFIWSRGTKAVGVEVKHTSTWRREDSAALKELLSNGAIQAGFGVYRGEQELRDGPLRVLPVEQFLKELAAGSILPA